jgi:hypothetical protein
MRYAILLSTLFIAACATGGGGNGGVAIDTVSNGQAVQGATCAVSTAAGNWNVTTPAVAPVGSARGDLRIICSKNGYRTSEVVYRPSSGFVPNVGVGVGGGSGHVGVGVGVGVPIALGGGGYPSRVTVEMNPQ